MLPRINPNRPWISGWSRRKLFSVTATYESRNRTLDLNVYNTSGTDAAGTIYLNGNIRADWGDLRFTKDDGVTPIDFGILRRASDHVVVALKVNVKNGSRNFYIYYDGPTADVFKIGRTTDQHYDPNGLTGDPPHHDRINSVTKLAAFNTRMGIYQPDLILHGGDHTGALSSVEATQLAWMETLLDETQNGPVGIPAEIVSPGNHDFEFISNANFRALIATYQSWMESGVNYGRCFENDDYIILSLDSNDISGGTHESISHKGYGYVGGTQMNWLKAQLDAATKPVIIDMHHPCGEMDTNQFTLTKEIYHTSNRLDFRNLIEQSGKVVAVIHGHMHFTRIDAIRGVPYIVCTNLTDDGSFDEVPLSTSGKWNEIEFDKSSQMINVKHVALISGDYETVYEYNVPFGRTSFFPQTGNSPEHVFSNGWGGGFARSGFLRDPTQLNAVSITNLYKFPFNYHTPDPLTLVDAIRIKGRNDDPNFGRALWTFKNMSDKFIFRAWVVLTATDKAVAIKIGNPASTQPKVYLLFQDDGHIHFLHGNVVTDLDFGAYSTNTVYDIELFIDPVAGGYAGVINGASIGSLSFYNGGANHEIRELEILTETTDFYIQGMTIRDWVSPRPTFGSSIGNEETN